MWSMKLILAALCVAAAHPFSVCNDAALRVTSVDVNPLPVIPGAQMRVSVNGTAMAGVASARATVVASVFGVKVGHASFDWCDSDLPCPLAAGDAFVANMLYAVPHQTPTRVHAVLEMIVRDDAGAQLACVRVSVATK